MSVISRANNFIFFHIPKCGGTSLLTFFQEKNISVNLINDSHSTNQETYSYFKHINDLKFYNQSNKFAIIRHPIQRAISLFKYIKVHNNHHLHDFVKKMSFVEFCYYLKQSKNQKNGITSCYSHLQNKNGSLENITIIKLEEINQNLPLLSRLVGFTVDCYPKVNISNANFNYTTECGEIIEDVFSEDFIYFYGK